MATTIFLVSFFLAFLQCRGDHVYDVVINEESPCSAELCLTLEEYAKAAAKYFTSNTMLRFRPGNHTLSIQGFIEIFDVNNLTLVGEDSYIPVPRVKGLPEPVRIVCNGSEYWNSGFAIINATNLNITRLSLCNCGTNSYSERLKNELLSVRNNSMFEMGFDLRVALLLVDLHSLLISNLTVEKGFGYGLLGLNILGAFVKGANFIENNLHTYLDSDCLQTSGRTCNTSRCTGGNALLVFEDHASNECQNKTYTFEIQKSNFIGGVSICEMPKEFINSGGGLGIIFSQSSFSVEVDIRNARMERNTGVIGGNLHVEFFFYVNGSTLRLHRTYIGHGNACNITWSAGGGLHLRYGRLWLGWYPMCGPANNGALQWNAFVMSECKIVHNKATVGAGIRFSVVSTDNPQHNASIMIKESLVSQNIGENGVAVYILEVNTSPAVKPIQIIFIRTTFFKNKYVNDEVNFLSTVLNDTGTTLLGAVWLISLTSVNITDCIFDSNELTGLAALDSHITFSGDNHFMMNRGFSGGGIGLSRSTMFLLPHTHLNFTKNHALQRGGGIYVDSSPFDQLSFCFFQIYDPSISVEVDISVVFWNNSANQSGLSLYGGVLDSCYMSTFSHYFERKGSEIVDLMFQFNDREPDSVSSNPFHVCICTNDNVNYDCGIKHHSITTYSGKPFQISVVAVGQMNGTAAAVVNAVIFDNNQTAYLKKLSALQKVQQFCTPLEYTIYSKFSKMNIHLRVEGIDILFYRYDTILDVTLKPCPLGFSISLALDCSCDPLLFEHGVEVCDINTQVIQKKQHLWIGIYKLSEGLIVHPHCPLDYCKNKQMNITLNDTDMQCAFERSGILCGTCRGNLSLALGSSQCLECSNSFLGFIALFIVFGILLVLVLLLLNLTVAVGTANGLIFYANILSMNHATCFPSGKIFLYGRMLSIFIAWMNLDFGIEVCFANGMDAYIKTWLQFVFPAYIWALVGLIIIASRYSVTLSNRLATNAVPVLATLFLLSYTKILRTIIAVLSFTFLDLPDETREAVWLHDGNVPYFKGKHVPLAVFAILVFLLIVIPYTFLLFFGQLLQAVSNRRLFQWVNKLMPFIDAHHAPYKGKHRYWTGLLLIVRIAILVTASANFTADPDINLVVVGCTAVFILGLSLSIGGVYRRSYLTVLESLFLSNLIALVILMLYFRQTDDRIAVNISVSIAFIIFICIVATHLISKFRFWGLLKPRVTELAASIAWPNQSQYGATETDSNQTFFREPLSLIDTY